ncbi:3-deoxy-manno-octulosonate cytidylyltransferase [Neolewinella lacunae]|uniref:3-deoxy-manno-octulosonate cytidylyltransferase n=1 Tax=Neolewinella lacunae TaxID=1517758 RepID=A0A923T8N1_9BACT|nr:3-deoxy-manno-octulosonate cytidylyltransferase [Neolewinella lacunae]MBC6994721.1 3-deoxy-manno-octulosonate cytidylyltransferase [Neolewinella lacunae]MDN3634593.1 3-deoxy-manno-octulosonate cytidylyltransferase [Neolewinella lacunae]
MVLAVIPARYASTRFPGKPLATLGDKSMVRHVYERVQACPAVDEVIVATDDMRIQEHVSSWGGRVELTDPTHPSGTDRVAEVAARFPEASIIVNVQGDEPFIDPRQIEAVLAPFADPGVAIATLARPILEEQSLLSPNVVKVVRDARGRALYFSRHAIPFLRDVPLGQWLQAGQHLQHLGLYAYRAEVLAQLTALSPATLETAESLEQLRWLAAGYAIAVGLTDLPSIGIDTPEDLEAARRHL